MRGMPTSVTVTLAFLRFTEFDPAQFSAFRHSAEHDWCSSGRLRTLGRPKVRRGGGWPGASDIRFRSDTQVIHQRPYAGQDLIRRRAENPRFKKPGMENTAFPIVHWRRLFLS
jgi:hypothetical protein